MTKKRDIINEIVSKRARGANRGPRYLAFHSRFKRITAGLDHLKSLADNDAAKEELLRYVPIAYVAALEGYYRHVIKDLINYGNPFSSNAERLDDIRVELRQIVRLRGTRVSVGELVGHLLPLKSFEDINRHLSVLIGEDYFTRLTKTPLKQEGATVGSARPLWRRELEALFEDRHILAHEVNPSLTIDTDRAWKHWTAATVLVLTDDTLMNVLMRPKRSRSARAV